MVFSVTKFVDSSSCLSSDTLVVVPSAVTAVVVVLEAASVETGGLSNRFDARAGCGVAKGDAALVLVPGVVDVEVVIADACVTVDVPEYGGGGMYGDVVFVEVIDDAGVGGIAVLVVPAFGFDTVPGVKYCGVAIIVAGTPGWSYPAPEYIGPETGAGAAVGP